MDVTVVLRFVDCQPETDVDELAQGVAKLIAESDLDVESSARFQRVECATFSRGTKPAEWARLMKRAAGREHVADVLLDVVEERAREQLTQLTSTQRRKRRR